MIYAVGDSHAWIFDSAKRVVRVLKNLGPATAYNLINSESSSGVGTIVLDWVKSANLTADDVLVLSFGALDCRLHILTKHIETQRSITRLIVETIDRYIEFIRLIQEIDPVDIVLLGPPPMGIEGNVHHVRHYGTREQRNDILRQFNLEMKRRAELAHLKYIDIWDLCTDDEGFMSQELAGDEVHLDSGKMGPIVERLIPV